MKTNYSYLLKDTSGGTIDTVLMKYDGSLARFYSEYPEDGLVAHWSFDGTLEDDTNNSDYSFEIFETGASIGFTTGLVNQCLIFDSSGGYSGPDAIIKLTNPDKIFDTIKDKNPYTLSYWLKMKASHGSNSYFATRIGFDSGGKYMYYSHPAGYIDVSLGYFGARILDGNYPVINTDNVGNIRNQFSDDVWHHYVITYDGTTVSGIADNYNITLDVSSYESLIYLTPKSGSTLEWKMSSTAYNDNVMLDSMFLYNRVLTDAEIAELWNNGNGV